VKLIEAEGLLRAALNKRTGNETKPNVMCPFQTLDAISAAPEPRQNSEAPNILQCPIRCKWATVKVLMPLEEYAKKRRFGATPNCARRQAGLRRLFLRAAPRCHAAALRFRLEIDGVLNVGGAEGPDARSSGEHFAAHVEDHPVEYGDFEGNIPAGNYGAAA